MAIKKKTRKQHYLPCSYLQFFDISGIPSGRDSRVYCIDGKRCFKQKVEDIAFENFFYSSNDPDSAEAVFHTEEQNYQYLVKEIESNRSIEGLNHVLMLNNMFTLHLRTSAFDNHTGLEQIEAYNQLNKTFLVAHIVDTPEQAENAEAIKNILLDNWRILPLFTKSPVFITSDHPAILFGDNKVRIVFLPIKPFLAVVAFDLRKVKQNGKSIVSDDIRKMNAVTCNHYNRFIFANYDMGKNEIEWQRLVKIMKRERPPRYINKDVSCIGMGELSSNNLNQCGLSFLETNHETKVSADQQPIVRK